MSERRTAHDGGRPKYEDGVPGAQDYKAGEHFGSTSEEERRRTPFSQDGPVRNGPDPDPNGPDPAQPVPDPNRPDPMRPYPEPGDPDPRRPLPGEPVPPQPL
jgi:hypothetical protein